MLFPTFSLRNVYFTGDSCEQRLGMVVLNLSCSDFIEINIASANKHGYAVECTCGINVSQQKQNYKILPPMNIEEGPYMENYGILSFNLR